MLVYAGTGLKPGMYHASMLSDRWACLCRFLKRLKGPGAVRGPESIWRAYTDKPGGSLGVREGGWLLIGRPSLATSSAP